ncbi:hypothetical protein H2200_011521 [Cladophialophora chaetospira]|uniref:Heterokaryon incompatibility domain-containing protein n=1 Tax=Cladophialophora chaetospira TaxID=386627 RepID=A0AA38WZH7_9EURO|nr:hypothetical protein H2200_011521 [Cladophialophora chaetospira]
MPGFKTLENSQRHFRLLTVAPAPSSAGLIRCSTEIYHLDGAPPYRAVSYTWGGGTKNRAIFLNGKKFKVRPNLYALLQHLQRSNYDSYFWIDAICIAQSDVRERNHQVRIMGSIYTKATEVLVWLGPELARSNELAEDLSMLCGNNHSYDNQTLRHCYRTLCERGNSQRFWDDLTSLCGNSYWLRCWILQEVSLAKHIQFLVGNTALDCNDLSWVCRALPVVATAVDGADGERVRDELSSNIGRVLHVLDRKSEGKSATLQGILMTTEKTDCADVRDRVFGVLGFAKDCNDVEGLQADYSWDVPRLFYEVITFCKPKERTIFTRRLSYLLEISKYKISEEIRAKPGWVQIAMSMNAGDIHYQWRPSWKQLRESALRPVGNRALDLEERIKLERQLNG